MTREVSTMASPWAMRHPVKRVAILFAGGPAPGANAVISTAATAFLRHNIETVGILHGYSHLVEYSPERPLVAVELKKHPDAHDMEGTGGLVVERRVGGGRVVVTRFALNDVRIKQWRNFDGFSSPQLGQRTVSGTGASAVPQKPHSLNRDGFSSPQDGQVTVSTNGVYESQPQPRGGPRYDEAASTAREVGRRCSAVRWPSMR